MKKARVVLTDLADPAYCTACDQAILEARDMGLVPDTLHLYRRSRPTISLGHFQKEEECVDMALARELGVEIVRRVSGGSAIYTDMGQWIYSVALGIEEVPERPMESYPIICEGIVIALAEMGIKAEWKPLNDVLVGGRKISGSAQTRKREAMLQHGTLLVSTDLERMTMLLLPSKGKRARTIDELTTMERELGRKVDMSSVEKHLVKGLGQALGLITSYGHLTDAEKRRIIEIVSTV